MRIQSHLRAAVATLALTTPSARAAAQTYLVDPGTPFVATGLSSAVLGSQMNGMALEVRFSDGSTSGGAWGFLFELGGIERYGVRNDLFSFSVRGDRDTGGPNPSEDDFNLANFNPSGATLVGFTLSGAPGGVAFDRTFAGLVGTAGSGPGRDVVEANDPGGNEFQMTATYRNLVRLPGQAPVGDLFETLEVSFGNPVPEGENYSLFLDTDRARSLSSVPEPAALWLVASGALAVGAAARRRRR